MTSKQKIINYMNENGYKLLNEDEVQNTHSKVNYICKCGENKTQIYKDFVKRDCRKCIEIKLKTIPEGGPIIDIETGEEWRPILGGWISNLGNCKNIFNKKLTLCPTKYRYSIGGKHYYASRLVAIAFQIPNYEKLDTQLFGVHHIDGNNTNNCVNNLIVRSKVDNGIINSQNSKQTNIFREKIQWNSSTFGEVECKNIPELPNHKIYKNGEIHNGERFLTFTKTENYLHFMISGKIVYKVHRLVCYAFNPIEGKTKFEDYDKLQVNHKDGNKLNNDADNLEWVTQSLNIQHAYDTGLNKKVRNIYQLDETSNIIKEFISIASASRETGETESNIRACCQGKRYTTCKYYWKFKNPEESQEYSKKYNKK